MTRSISLVIDRYVKHQVGWDTTDEKDGQQAAVGGEKIRTSLEGLLQCARAPVVCGMPASGKSDDEARSLHARTRVRDTFLVVNSWTHQTASYMHERLASLHWALDRSA
jgi:hypothetical protein